MSPINQILATGIEIKSVDIKKIVKFFCIIIIVFGIIFIGEGSYGIVRNNEEIRRIQEEKGNPPTVSIMQYDETHAKIHVTSDRGIKGVWYHWNSEDSTKIDAEGKRIVEELVELPVRK